MENRNAARRTLIDSGDRAVDILGELLKTDEKRATRAAYAITLINSTAAFNALVTAWSSNRSSTLTSEEDVSTCF